MNLQEKYRGCLIGGAVGDVLGYAVEFITEEEILARYGRPGITRYKLTRGVALISDDTQMTLFTANGLLCAAARGTAQEDVVGHLPYIAVCYRDWLKTQGMGHFGTQMPEMAWLNSVPEMNHPRAPGGTCMHYLAQEKLGSVAAPCNTRKGCGGVMRVAPIGLCFPKQSGDAVAMLGAEAAALTHGHELGYIPAAMLAHMVHSLVHGDALSVRSAVEEAKAAAARLFPRTKHLATMLALTDRALALAGEGAEDPEAIRALGEGWVAEETLAIAIYCAAKYETDFEKAMIAAVNHSGDSDSTGAVAGNILGARLGLEGIPEKFLTRLELKETVLTVADDLFHAFAEGRREGDWEAKYIRCPDPKA